MKYIKLSLALLIVFLVSCKEKIQEEVTEVKPTEFKIDYEKFTLDNGLEVIIHEDHSDPIVAVATMMHVGSNREKPGRTGFAHFFEHMSFNDSENVPRGANRKMIPEWGGSRNGGTWSDGTVYYEVVPKDAFDKIMWIDSDRFGYMINTVTKAALEREKQVVKNEKRQRVDNAPYGYTDEIIRKNLYPEGHPYNWTVIGQLPDLQAATIDDVKEFYNQYYGAANATLVIAGDIDVAETKQKVKQWFGEIRKGPDVEPLQPMPVTLNETKSLYFEDNFAKLPELRIVIPTVEEYHKDTYALQILGNLLSGSKKAPLYQVLVEEEKLTPNVSTYQSSSELAGEFVFRVRANAGVNLDSVKRAINEGLTRFEENGVSPKDLKRIKAELETSLYRGVSTVLNKAFQLAQDNEFNGDPSYITQTAKLTQAVTPEDVMRVYNKYIKNANYVMTSVIPKGQLELAVDNADKAEVWIEEVKQDVASEEVSQGEEAEYEKTPSKYDRSEPSFGELPLFKAPEVYQGSLENGLTVYGIENNEVPLIQFDITIPGGHLMDPKGKSGVSNLFTDLMMEGTANKTPAELEEAIGLLGASINMYTASEDMHISGSCLAKNFNETMSLVKEIILEPRWDTKEFARLKQALETSLKDSESNPRRIAYNVYAKLLYGDNHNFGVPVSGTLETAKSITINDLKAFYSNLSPKDANLHVVGDLNQSQVMDVANMLNDWNTPKPIQPRYTLPENPKTNTVYFVDVPGSKQSVLYIGKLALSETNPEANNLAYANEILGGGSSGRLFQTLRIEKGYTYGAYSGIRESKEVGPFYINSSVRANATLASLEIIKTMVANYADNFGEEEVKITKDKLLKENTRAFESLGAKLGMLQNISKYNKPVDFVKQDQNELVDMSLNDYHNMINKYLQEEDMLYIVVGDKETQWQEVEKLGKPMVELDIHGNDVK
ncbi:M16 family metallopeptidase [Mangrovimonas spongiae]|uniref:Insulinase family protein n=1 Tax=Mangrovimonas spongiae TaxID=2494697 RepID=A0A428JWZ7_9FLAO|nr:pitrilysin family protein [Mangrovimonas spongiae]RSK38614.1 insulinase family protein [Mangrovimonas spongiae]